MSVAPRRPQVPPLNAMRAFEAAARLSSFSAAADELCVTPGAVAQQVKALEAWAGTNLFARLPQGVELTELGEMLLPSFSTAFDHLGEAAQALRAGASPGQVHIATLPSLAQLWLSPRLPAIRETITGLAVSVTALESPPNLKREQFDLSIFLTEMPIGPDTIQIGRDSIFPVCAPSLVSRLRHPRDLADMTFLHDANWSSDWQTWLGAACPDLQLDTRGPAFSLYSLAVEEAQNGAGVLIGHDVLVEQHLSAGTLVDPFSQRVELETILTIEAARPLLEGSPAALIASALCRGVKAPRSS